jgi:DNA-binding protein YbaB
MNDMRQIFKQSQQLQKQLEMAQKEMELKEVEGASGVGLVKVTMNLKGIVKSIKIESQSETFSSISVFIGNNFETFN